jgi:hypothetical protein
VELITGYGEREWKMFCTKCGTPESEYKYVPTARHFVCTCGTVQDEDVQKFCNVCGTNAYELWGELASDDGESSGGGAASLIGGVVGGFAKGFIEGLFDDDD